MMRVSFKREVIMSDNGSRKIRHIKGFLIGICNLKSTLTLVSKGVFAILLAVFSANLPTKIASATSVYDNSYQTASSLVLDAAYCGGTDSIDLKNNWASYITDPSKWYNPAWQYLPNGWPMLTKASFENAINSPNGSWGVTLGGNGQFVEIFWSNGGNPTQLWWYANYIIFGGTPSSGTSANSVRLYCGHSTYGTGGNTVYANVGNYDNGNGLTVSLADGSYRNLFVHNSDSNYPSGYAGTLINTSDNWSDMDGDGLIAADEVAQSTSDTKRDTDGDGLNDHIESTQFNNRVSVFCDTIPNPDVCAYPDPIEKDVYVEIDWMNDTVNSRILKPSNTQLGIVESMFGSEDINIHFDTGEFGGGNELSAYTEILPLTDTSLVTDFGDIKAGNFDSDREGIWKYLVYGYEYIEVPGSSGRAEVSGDDIFISGGLVEDNPNTVSKDRAVAGTVAHEIGHTLCLSQTQMYVEQPSECVHGSIDNDSNKPLTYESVMNYRYQLTVDDDLGVVDFSDGTHGSGDHDDWEAIELGMADFTGTQTAVGASSKVALTEKKTMDPDLIVSEKPMEHFQPKQDKPVVVTESIKPNESTAKDVKADAVKAGSPKTETSQNYDSNSQLLPVVIGLLAIVGLGGTAVWRMRQNK